MNRLILITYLILSLTIELIACDCKSREELNRARELEFEYSELVIIGEVVFLSTDKKDYQILVKEVFKGNLEIGQIINGQNNLECEPYIEDLGEYLIYGKITDKILSQNVCGLSRSIEHPENNRYFWQVPQPIVDISEEEWNLLKNKIKEKEKQNALIEISNEIELLRKRKK